MVVLLGSLDSRPVISKRATRFSRLESFSLGASGPDSEWEHSPLEYWE